VTPKADATVPSLCVRNAALESGSDAHYTDPRYYAETYAERALDITYYQGLGAALPESGCEVLEYGCGNGRIAIPLAQAGCKVTAVDRSKPMLADFRKRLHGTGDVKRRITIKEGDMRSVRLRHQFPLVLCTFNTFLHLYTRQDVERFLRRVCAHLAKRSRFVVDISVPEPEELCRDSGRAYRVPRFRHPTTGEVVRYAERFDYDALAQVLTVGMEFEPLHNKEGSWETPLAHRQFFPQEMEALLHYNGLEVVDIHADFEHKAPDSESEALIYHCKKRR
jgi:SAM-dependent methyltransferase